MLPFIRYLDRKLSSYSYPIPSSLYIKDSETYIYFSYLEQPKTCHKCGSELHMVNQCDIYQTTKPKD